MAQIQKLHRGLFLVEIGYANNGTDGVGTGAAESLADAVKAVFEPGASLTQGSETVTIRYAERAAAVEELDWIRATVTIGWQCFSERN